MMLRECTHLKAEDIAALAKLLQATVEAGASVGFLAPLEEGEARAYWQAVGGALGGPALRCWVAEMNGQPVGSVQLAPCLRANGRHRAEIQKLMVHPAHRRAGIAAGLMQAAEDAAHAQGCTLLVLDTEAGSPAERFYRHLGWEAVGDIPDYALTPDGQLLTTRYFYKRLGRR